MTAIYLVFTDLDGSLLDHDSYSYEPARPVLEELESLRIPVIMASSKTRREMLALRAAVGNEHPFIAENGAAVCIPESYFITQPEGCERQGNYWVRNFAPPRARWLALLKELAPLFPGCFRNFGAAGVEGIVEMTGLTADAAAAANEREFSEPLQWLGRDSDLPEFLAALEDGGATVQRGGRFFAVGGDCDKGTAHSWLRERYVLAAGASAVYDLAVGDGQNDVPMLEQAHRALLISARNRALPALLRSEGVLSGRGFGPEAWADGVRKWLQELDALPEDG